jgi:glycosyltransferase involved in cell wall biosynthesis
MISVLSIIDTHGPGGAETVFLETACRLDPARFRPLAVIPGEGWLAEQLRERGVEPHLAPAKGSFNIRYLAALLRLTRQSAADVVVAHLYGSAVYASLLGRILPIPVVSVLHGQTDISPTARLAALKSAIVRGGSRKVVFVSKRLEEDLEPQLRLAPAQSLVIPNGVDTDLFSPVRNRSLRDELGLGDDTLLIGAIGNVRSPKAYDVLLRAAHILLGRSPRFHFVIAGDCSGSLGQQMSELARELGIARSVTFLGLRSDVARILNALDVFALSSTTEGFSIACIEAMACGVPVVATRSGGPEQLLGNGAGVLVPTRDPAALARGIEQVASSPEFAASLVATALNRVRDEYSLTRMLSRYADLLTSVVITASR